MQVRLQDHAAGLLRRAVWEELLVVAREEEARVLEVAVAAEEEVVVVVEEAVVVVKTVNLPSDASDDCDLVCVSAIRDFLMGLRQLLDSW